MISMQVYPCYKKGLTHETTRDWMIAAPYLKILYLVRPMINEWNTMLQNSNKKPT